MVDLHRWIRLMIELPIHSDIIPGSWTTRLQNLWLRFGRLGWDALDLYFKDLRYPDGQVYNMDSYHDLFRYLDWLAAQSTTERIQLTEQTILYLCDSQHNIMCCMKIVEVHDKKKFVVVLNNFASVDKDHISSKDWFQKAGCDIQKYSWKVYA